MVVIPRLINLQPIRDKILADVSQAVGGEVTCQTVELAFRPLPCVLVREGSLSVPEKLSGNMKCLRVYPKILPLLVGDVKVSSLRVEGPALTIRLLERKKEDQEKTKPLSAEIIEQRMASLLDSVASKAPGLVVLVKNGSLNLFQGSQPVLSLEIIHGRIALPSRKIKIDIACQSNLWESLSLKGRWDLSHSERSEKFVMGQTSPLVSLEVEGKGVNVHSTRETAITLAGEMRIIENIFRVLKGGKVPRITFKVQGNRIADLKKKENFVIAGSMMDGRLSIPKVDLDLEEVTGEVLISKGILQGSNLEARWQNALGHRGKLNLGLTGKNAPFHLDIELEADLAQLPAFLEQRIRKGSFVEEIRRIEALEGRGTGRLILGESLRSIKTRVDVSEFKLSAKYQRVPYALEIVGGRFSYDETGIDVENLSGEVGDSSFSELSAALAWGEEPYFKLEAASSKVVLEEIYPWLVSFEAIGTRLKNLGSVKGLVELSTPSLKGPLLRPDSWHFDTKGEVKHLAIETSRFPGPIEVARGRFHAIEDGTEQELSFADAQVRMLDGSLEGSGVLKDYLAGLNGADLSLEGNMHSEFIQWLSGIIRIPPALKPRSPLKISHGHLVWDRDATTSFAGDLVVQEGPKVTIDILKDDKELNIRNMLIQDQDTNAGLKFDVTRKALNLEFSGHLTKATLGRLFEEKQVAQGWVEGDIRIHILTDDPMKSKAQGSLEGGDLFLPLNVKAPLEIDSISFGKTTAWQPKETWFFRLMDCN